jgi:hypothetical protein
MLRKVPLSKIYATSREVMGLFYAGRSANINSYEKKYDIEVNVQFFGHVKQKT